MDGMGHTYCWWFRNPANQSIWRIHHYFQGFIHPMWCGISSINTMYCTYHVISTYSFAVLAQVDLQARNIGVFVFWEGAYQVHQQHLHQTKRSQSGPVQLQTLFCWLAAQSFMAYGLICYTPKDPPETCDDWYFSCKCFGAHSLPSRI